MLQTKPNSVCLLITFPSFLVFSRVNVSREKTVIGKLLLILPDPDTERPRAASQKIRIRESGRGEQRKC